MSNSFYNHASGVPIAQSRGTSSSLRSEFDAIALAFDGLAGVASSDLITDTSVTSVTIAIGLATFTVSAGRLFVPGMYLVIANTPAASTNSLWCQVTSYSGTTLNVDVKSIAGGGTYAAWSISRSAPNADLAGATFGAPSKVTPVDADLLPLVDSAAANVLKSLSWANLKIALRLFLSGTTFPIGTTTPSTATFTTVNATSFVGPLTGNASTATTAATATNATTATTATNATNATNLATASDNASNANYFPLWTSVENSTQAVKTSGGKISFNPAAGILNITGYFNGALNGIVGNITPSTGAFTTLNATGQLLLSTGVVAAPSLGIGATNNGLFAPTGSTVGVSNGGTEATRWSGSQQQGPMGSAVSPTYSFLAAGGAGMWNPGPNQLAFSAGGLQVGMFNAAGFGIGKTPTAPLDVLGNAQVSGQLLLNTSTGNNSANRLLVKGAVGDDRIAVETANTGALASLEAQDTGYWTTPTYSGTAIMQFGAAYAGTTAGVANAGLGALRFQNNTGGLIYTNNVVPIVFGTAAVERMRISGGGFVGIAMPPNGNAQLQVSQASSPYGFELLAAVGGANVGSAIVRLLNNANTVERMTIAATSDTFSYIGAASILAFNTAGAERMRIAATGEVGIGGAPAGSVGLTVYGTNSQVLSQATAGFGSFYAKGSGANSAYVFLGNVTNGEQGRIEANSSTLIFYTGSSATERLRLSASGAAVTGPLSATGTVTGSNLSGTNTGDSAANSTYAADYRAANFVAGTNYLAPTGSAAGLTGLLSGQVTTALGFTPYNTTNPSGYISSVTWATPGAIGSTTPSTGVFTSLSATGTVTGGSVVANAGTTGYGVGAGGTVTQATSINTSVTLNKACGVITTASFSFTAGVTQTFTVNNSLCTGFCTVLLTPSMPGLAVSVVEQISGSFKIVIRPDSTVSGVGTITFALIQVSTT